MKPLVIDGHEDIAYNVINAGRDYTRSALDTRRADAANPDFPRHMGTATLGVPEWREGRVAVIFATIFVEPSRSTFSAAAAHKYSDPDEARAAGLRQLEVYRALAGHGGPFRLIRDRQDLDAVLTTWQEPSREDGARAPTIGLLLLMENADPIRTPEELDAWYEAGVRAIGPAWMSSRYCGGTFEPGPLTTLGRQLLARMARRGMILDLSHMAEEACHEAVDVYAGPVVASHSNPRRFVEGDRHLSDAMIRRLAARDGVIGQVPFNAFLVPDWRAQGARKDAADLSTVVRAIDHVCQLAGSARHVAFGSDLDGGFGAESTPLGIDTVADLQGIAAALTNRGYADEDVEAIAHGNWMRVLHQVLGA